MNFSNKVAGIAIILWGIISVPISGDITFFIFATILGGGVIIVKPEQKSAKSESVRKLYHLHLDADEKSKLDHLSKMLEMSRGEILRQSLDMYYNVAIRVTPHHLEEEKRCG